MRRVLIDNLEFTADLSDKVALRNLPQCLNAALHRRKIGLHGLRHAIFEANGDFCPPPSGDCSSAGEKDPVLRDKRLS